MEKVIVKLSPFLIIILAILLLFFSFNCTKSMNYLKGGPYYFEGFVHYKIPFCPIKRLTEKEAKARVAYFEAYFNSEGMLVVFRKYYHGQVDFADHYFYHQSGKLEHRELVKENGEKVIQYFDNNGKLIKK